MARSTRTGGRAPAGSITAVDIAWCASGTSGTTTWRHNWAKAGRLKKHPPFNRNDAVETAIAWHLAQPPRQKKATAAWDVLRKPLLKLIIAGHDDIWLVIGSEGYRHAAVVGAAAAAEAASGLGVACFLLPTAEVVEAATARFADITKGQTSGSAGVTNIAQGRKNAP